MAFNARDAEFESTEAMVRAMADDDAEQVAAFVALIRAWELDGALRAHDLRAFART